MPALIVKITDPTLGNVSYLSKQDNGAVRLMSAGDIPLAISNVCSGDAQEMILRCRNCQSDVALRAVVQQCVYRQYQVELLAEDLRSGVGPDLAEALEALDLLVKSGNPNNKARAKRILAKHKFISRYAAV